MSSRFRIFLDKRNNIKIVEVTDKNTYDESRFVGREHNSYDAASFELIAIKEKLGRKLTLLERMKKAAKEVNEERVDEKVDEETKNNVFRIYKNIKDELVIVSCNPIHCTHVRNRFYTKEKYATEENAMRDLIRIKNHLHMELTAKEKKFEAEMEQ